ncbi:MAG: hypothetical protein ABJM06_05085 [Gilvibacter sp.]
MFKKTSRLRALNKRLDNALSADSIPVFDRKIKKVLILVQDDEVNYNNLFKDLHIGLATESKDVHLLRFKDKTEKKEVRPFDIITPEQFDKKGLIVGDFAPFNPDTQYDLVLAYYEQPQLFLNTIVMDQQKAFKVGLQGNHEALFHFIITTKTSQFDLFIAELLRYLRILSFIA